MNIAIVTPWFGEEAKGGAEQQARQVALRLALKGHYVEVLTTSCRSFDDDWGVSSLPEGSYRENGVTIRRFPPDKRNAREFLRVRDLLLATTITRQCTLHRLISPNDERIFVDENINSAALSEYLREHKERYEAILFIPYLYGTTLKILPDVADKALLQPCLHDEPYAYLPVVRKIFEKAKALFFNSEGELQLAVRLYGPAIFSKSKLIGEGIEFNSFPSDSTDIALPPELKDHPFVLYLGRRDVTKGLDLLLRAYGKFKLTYPFSKLKLVLAGPGPSINIPSEGIFDLGWVNEPTKVALLNRCLALLQPSKNESYSRTIMEAWSRSKPVAANGECLATALAVRRSGGGWLATGEDDWCKIFAQIAFSPPIILRRLGERGREYALQHADWEKVIDRYEEAIESKTCKISVTQSRRLNAIHQLLPDLAYGDAISNQAIAIRDRLRMLGYASEIFAINLHEQMRNEGKNFSPSCIKPEEGIIYHHSIGSEITPYAMFHSGPKCLIYHNITPPEFFAPYRPGFAWLLERGLIDLSRLAKHFSLSAGDSTFNAMSLAEAGFDAPEVLPIIVDPDRWQIAEDLDLLEKLLDGRTNLLFVGRIAPNKCQDRLIEAFAQYRNFDENSRLILVGEAKPFDPYFQKLRRRVLELNLTNQVIITGHVSDAQLMSYYKAADLFWSFSEHEGFCVPIVEAMWFDIPVLALKSTAIAETLGGAGILFESKERLSEVVALARRLVFDERFKSEIMIAQRQRREAFLPKAIWPHLDRIVERMERATMAMKSKFT